MFQKVNTYKQVSKKFVFRSATCYTLSLKKAAKDSYQGRQGKLLRQIFLSPKNRPIREPPV
jgi:hypothetical protein